MLCCQITCSNVLRSTTSKIHQSNLASRKPLPHSDLQKHRFLGASGSNSKLSLQLSSLSPEVPYRGNRVKHFMRVAARALFPCAPKLIASNFAALGLQYKTFPCFKEYKPTLVQHPIPRTSPARWIAMQKQRRVARASFNHTRVGRVSDCGTPMTVTDPPQTMTLMPPNSSARVPPTPRLLLHISALEVL